jgi:hypothetical protein
MNLFDEIDKKNFRPALYLGLLSTSLFTLPSFSATRMIGQYWAFAPWCSETDHKDNSFYDIIFSDRYQNNI